MSWRLLDEQDSDVYNNLAIDEAIAKTDLGAANTLNTIRFWKSSRSVVIGRFQCVHKEVNLDYCKDNNISIARRFTGGGAVFHDFGNLNFSLRLHQSHDYVPRGLKELYEALIGRITESLNRLGIPARFDPVGSCIRIGEKKISGTAGWIKQGVSFIHGTLLIDADLKILQRSLSPPDHQQVFLRDRTRIRCMESKHDSVTNINAEHKGDICVDEIKASIMESLQDLSGATILKKPLTRLEKDTAQALYESQYSLPSWNLGTPANSTP
jgi:lipoate-protein ligase A